MCCFVASDNCSSMAFQEHSFSTDDLNVQLKSLPRLPSEDDAYEIVESSQTPSSRPSSLTPSAPPTHSVSVSSRSSSASPPPHDDTPSQTTSSSRTSESDRADSISRLSGLRHTFQRTEQNLYAELSRTPSATLNDVRRSFITAARGASRRLTAWEAKHSSQMHKSASGPNVHSIDEPEWWKSNCHAVPGGKFIVREDDWGSIIAFTLR